MCHMNNYGYYAFANIPNWEDADAVQAQAAAT